ncbi:aldehyde dehydrogenase family protein [Palleronia abyssalis]|uniref:Vanillin dehydrogenase n=1 Tax=Palleronia abyssalis TaxID=1501240 RepID=A0A2R8BVP0_9RHOB|nr:aldehyde dehydrogenase family protein [Palleronia abyssalis]SPJ24205.1 Vanillin dehydrogenase [Palleronia abyssalis]
MPDGGGRAGGSSLYEAQLIIDGAGLPCPGASVFELRGPLTDAVVTRAVAARASQARAAATSAAAAFPAWSETPPQRRSAILRDAARLMLERQSEVVAIAAQEVGASAEWTRFNVGIAVAMLRQAGEIAMPSAAESSSDLGAAGLMTLRRRPAGVVLAIAPWNAPVSLATRAVAAPLACGNTVVLKASELCAKTHEWVARAVIDAGLPPGALNFVTNAPDHAQEVVGALIEHPAVRRVTFTGSSRVGREIAVMAAHHLKPCVLELSGKGTAIVLADADLDRAAREVAHGAFFNQGQVCMSTERVLVEEAVAEPFLAKLVAEANAQRAATPSQSPLGALVSPGAVARLRGFIHDAESRGAVVAAGGEALGTLVQPTVIDRVTPDMRLFSEEAFGPIVGVTRVGDAEEAVSLANLTEFGLVASVFSRDEGRAMRMLRQIETGIGHVNRTTVFDDPTMPFGGVRASGYGRYGGLEAIHEFTECHALTTNPAGDASAGSTDHHHVNREETT